MFWNARKVAQIGASALDVGAAAEMAVYEFGEKAWLKRIIFAITTVHETTKSVITVKKRFVDASGGADLGTFEVPAAAVVNSVYYVDLPLPDGLPSTLVDGSVGYDALPDWVIADVGEELALTSDGGGTGNATFWVEYQACGDQPLPGGWTRMPFTAA